MADGEEKEQPVARGNEWEVVSLTASAYAAAPSLEQAGMNDEENGNSVAEDEAETSQALFMSSHFVFPPSQHENLPLEPEHIEISSVLESEDAGFQPLGEERIQSDTKEQEMINTKRLTMSDEFLGIPIFDEEGNILPVSGTEFEEDTAFQGLSLVDKEQSLYNTESENFSSFQSESTIGGSANMGEDAENTEAAEPYNQLLDSGLPKRTEQKFDGPDLSCGAWWKRQAASFYAHAKEANTFWSIFFAAAAMGLVILGQQWQQERWKVLQLKWQFSINDERMVGRVLRPLTRLKDVIVGGQQRGSLLRGSTSMDQ